MFQKKCKKKYLKKISKHVDKEALAEIDEELEAGQAKLAKLSEKFG